MEKIDSRTNLLIAQPIINGCWRYKKCTACTIKHFMAAKNTVAHYNYSKMMFLVLIKFITEDSNAIHTIITTR